MAMKRRPRRRKGRPLRLWIDADDDSEATPLVEQDGFEVVGWSDRPDPAEGDHEEEERIVDGIVTSDAVVAFRSEMSYAVVAARMLDIPVLTPEQLGCSRTKVSSG